MTGVKLHNSKGLVPTLEAIVVKRKTPPQRAASTCVPTQATEVPTTCTPSHSMATLPTSWLGERKSRIKNRHHHKKARRRIVVVCRSWFNRFRKRLVQYELLDRSFLALNHLAAASITFRKMPAKINIIYGKSPSSDALEQALNARRPELDGELSHHSDRGAQYVSIRSANSSQKLAWSHRWATSATATTTPWPRR